ncbi:MAG: formate--tetrahydrofolate ligase [Clostridia bacterium]|nr:formate--tetrahydrofolate ligase [Clostridia bacterium]
MTDIEIAQKATLKDIGEIAKTAQIPDDALIRYGNTMAKVNPNKLKSNKQGKLILVTAINPTPAGEGKTTTSVGLADGLSLIGKNVMLALREPSLGPVFGVKGGAAGGGYSQVVPMEEINLHFTGDLHAITSANNLLAALVDNHVHQGNELDIDIEKIVWRRCMDVNDRQLRNIQSGLGGEKNGTPHADGFDITAASEIMAVLCLAKDLKDLKKRLSSIVVAYNKSGKPVTAGQLNAQGALATLLKQAMMPNLVQTLAHTPAFIHGGPFANIAHGCNTVVATKTAISLADYVVTEAGFGADLGAEKFLDIKCRMAELKPSAVVIVATIRALKHHGGVSLDKLNEENVEAVKKGTANLEKHIENITKVYNLPAVVSINRFTSDTEAEIAAVKEACEKLGAKAVLSDVWAKGGEGAKELAQEVVSLCEKNSSLTFSYNLEDDYKKKIEDIAVKVYGAKSVTYTEQALSALKDIEGNGYLGLPVCVAKTQYSLSDDAKALGRPQDFEVTIRNVRLSAGAGFIVAFSGNIIAMPGLPKVPAANSIDIDDNGNISGLF